MWVTIRRPRGKEKKPTRATSSTARGSITALLRKERRNEDKTHVKQLSGTIFSKDRALNVLKEWYFCLLCRAGFYFAFSIFSHLFDSPEGGGEVTICTRLRRDYKHFHASSSSSPSSSSLSSSSSSSSTYKCALAKRLVLTCKSL